MSVMRWPKRCPPGSLPSNALAQRAANPSTASWLGQTVAEAGATLVDRAGDRHATDKPEASSQATTALSETGALAPGAGAGHYADRKRH